MSRHCYLYFFICSEMWCLLLSGCGDHMPTLSAQHLAEFLTAEPAGPSLDMERILMARITGGAYRIVVGDVLHLELPRIVAPESSNGAGTGSRETYVCRVNNDGTIVLPVIGSFAAAGESLADLDSGILAAYYPKYIKTPFPIYVTVLEYSTRTVSIAGAVAQPGVYALRSDQMSLVSLLMRAGGIVQRGATVIRIAHTGPSSPSGTPTSAPSWNARRQGFGPLAQTHILHEAQIAGGAGARMSRMTPYMTFDHEGPLRTTGWLTIVEQGNVRARKWLDLACMPQRSAFLREATATTGHAPTAGMQERLVRLADALESLPLGQVDAVTQVCGWDTGGGGRLVTPLNESRPDSGRLSKEVTAPARFAELTTGQASATLALPVKGLNIPFADVALEEGDSVVVEPSAEQFVCVLGLVRNAGNFPYPPGARYNLAQAIGLAGGLDLVADPRFVNIYRLKPDGEIASVTVQLVDPKRKQALTEVLAMPVMPGDIVSVEQTPRTRTNILLDRVFRVSLGLYLTPDDIWNNK